MLGLTENTFLWRKVGSKRRGGMLRNRQDATELERTGRFTSMYQ